MRALAAVVFLAALVAAQEDRLFDGDASVRAAAAKELGKLGPGAAFAVPRLIALLHDDADAPRLAAIRALGRIGPAAREAGPYLVDLALGRADLEPLIADALLRIGAPPPEPPLILWLRARGGIPAGPSSLAALAKDPMPLRGHLLKALADDDALVIAQSARLLSTLARSDEQVARALVPLLDHPSAWVRLWAGSALSQSPLAAPVFVSMIEGADVKRRRVAARFFRGPGAIPYLRRALRDEDADVRRQAVLGFSVTELRDPGVLLELGGVLDRDPVLTSHLSSLLGALGPAAAPVVPAFARQLGSEDPGIRGAACHALGRIGAPAGPAAPALAMACFDARSDVASAAVGALKSLGKAAKEAAPYLAELAEASPSMAPHARLALAAIGEGTPLPPLPDAAELPALRARLRDPDARVAGRAAFAIGRLAPQDAETAGALAAALAHGSPYVRTHASLALQRIGPSSLPAFARVAKEGHGPARELAVAALQGYAISDPTQVLSVAAELLRGDDPYLKREAARTAGIIGRPARDAVPALIACLASEDPELVRAALWALGRMGPDATAAVPALAALLGTFDDTRDDWFVVTALGEIGTGAEAAIPAIVAAGMRPRSSLLGPATEALVKIGPAGHAALVAMLRDETGYARTAAILALSRQNLRPAGLEEALNRAVTDPDAGVRNSALMYMRQLGVETGPTAEALAAALRNSTPGDAAHLARVTADAATVATLLEVVRHEDARVRQQAWQALALKDPERFTDADRAAALPLLLEALDDAGTCAAAAMTLRSVPVKEPDARLLRAMNDRRDLGRYVAKALLALGDKAVPGLAAALGDKNARVRTGAALALAQLGPAAAPAVPALRRAALAEPEVGTYVKAIAATRDLETIAALYADPRMPGRGFLGEALVAAGEDALPHIDALRRHGSSAVRRDTVFLLQKLGEAGLPRLLDAAADPDDEVARAAMPALARGKAPADRAVPALARALARPGVRGEALRILATYGTEALPALSHAAADPDPKVRAQVLAAVRPLGEAALDLLLKGIEDDDENVRRAAAAALSEIGPGAAPAVPPLVALIRTGGPKVKETAAMTLDGLRATAKPALPALVGLMDDPDPAVRAAAAYPLGRFAADSESALGALRKGLGDRDAAVRRASALALCRAGPAAALVLPELLALFEKGERLERDAAGQALAKIGAKAAPGLARFLADADEERKKSAQNYLVWIGAPAVPAIVALADHEEERARRQAYETLLHMGARAIDGLTELLRHERADVRRGAAWALGKLGSAAQVAVPALVLALEDADPQTASQAAWALGQMGPAAKEALPALEKMYAEKRHRVIVADAIRRIRGE